MQHDRFMRTVTADSFGTGLAAVTPSDSADLPEIARALYITGAGDLAAIGADGVAFTITGLVAKTWFPVAVSRVKAAGTTATGIFAMW